MTLVTVFGGTGFLGRHIVERLSRDGVSVRVAVRHPKDGTVNAAQDSRQPISVAADIRNDSSVAAAIEGADGSSTLFLRT